MVSASLIGTCLANIQSHRFYKHYWDTFDVVSVESDEMKEKIYRLRHEIFCEENNYGFASDIAGDLEYDSFDERAMHFALLHKKTKNIVGTVRFVHPEQDLSNFSLPLQEICDHPMLHDDETVFQLGEVSRFCMSQDFRQRTGDGATLPTYSKPDHPGAYQKDNVAYYRRNIPYAPLGLLGAALEAALDSGIVNCVTALDPRDLPALKFLGMEYRVLGPNLEHYGYMQPIAFNILDFLDQMEYKNRGCWEIITKKGTMIKKSHRALNNIWQDSLFKSTVKEEAIGKFLRDE